MSICALVTTSQLICIFNLTDDDSGKADALVNEPNSVSKQMLPAHVREMHRNRDEGFETEFGVRTLIHLPPQLIYNSMQSSIYNLCNRFSN